MRVRVRVRVGTCMHTASMCMCMHMPAGSGGRIGATSRAVWICAVGPTDDRHYMPVEAGRGWGDAPSEPQGDGWGEGWGEGWDEGWGLELGGQ